MAHIRFGIQRASCNLLRVFMRKHWDISVDKTTH